MEINFYACSLRHTKAPSLREYSHRHGSANSEVGFCLKNYVVQRLDWTLLRRATSLREGGFNLSVSFP
jgi:hypothetical protein